MIRDDPFSDARHCHGLRGISKDFFRGGHMTTVMSEEWFNECAFTVS
jgi:hypothetical protein